MKKILYVEDSVTSQKIFQRMFYPVHEVTLAATSRTARELMEQLSFDLIVCDFQLAQGDAFELITPVRVKYSPKDLPIIAVSGSMDQALTAHLLAAGANACANKPLNTDDFRRLVDSMLNLAYVQANRDDVVTTTCFQWVENGLYHEFSPETEAHLTGTNRTEVSERMLALLHSRRVNGTTLGHITQERIRPYVLRERRTSLD